MKIDWYTKAVLTLGVSALIAIAVSCWTEWPATLRPKRAEAQETGCPATAKRDINKNLKLITSMTWRGTEAFVFEGESFLFLVKSNSLTGDLREGTLDCPYIRIPRSTLPQQRLPMN